MKLDTILNIMTKYQLTADEVLLIYLTFIAQTENGNPEEHRIYFKKWYDGGGNKRLKSLFNSLKDKGILTATIEGILPEKYNTPEIVTEILEKALDNGVKTIDHLRFIVQDLLFAKIKATVNNKKVDKTMNPVDKPAKRSKSTATTKSKVVA